MSIVHYFFTGFSFLSFILALLFFFKKKEDRVANFLLGILLLLYSYFLIYSVIFWTGVIAKFPNLIATFYIPAPLLGTIFYLYVKRVISPKKITLWDALYFLPFLFVSLSFWGFYIQSTENKIFIVKNNLFNDYVFLSKYIDLIISFFLIFFGIKSYLLFRNTNSDDMDIRLWVKVISITFICFAISYLSYTFLFYLNLLTVSQDYLISFMLVVFIALVSYFAFMQPDLFNGKPVEQIIPLPHRLNVKYQRTGLSKELSKDLKEKLLNLMEEDKLFLESEINLLDIAKLLNVSRNQASQVINENFDLSFYDFINSYRIAEAKELIDNKLNFTEIAYTVGFNNRISFYKAFKKFTGLNPTQFKEKLQ